MIHIEGFGKDINLLDKLSNNYELGAGFQFDEESTDVISNVLVQIYHSKKQCSLEKAMEGHLRAILGDLELTGQEFGYSEYTVEGFDVTKAKIGNHDLQKIIAGYGEEYLHVLIREAERE